MRLPSASAFSKFDSKVLGPWPGSMGFCFPLEMAQDERGSRKQNIVFHDDLIVDTSSADVAKSIAAAI